jgi:hypothetical protein
MTAFYSQPPELAVSWWVVGKQETMGLWSHNHFTLIPGSLESMNAGRPTQRE